MFSALQNAARAATQAARSLAGVSVVYKRGTATCDIDKAGVGSTPFRISDSDFGTKIYAMRDYLIQADDLVINGEYVEPQLGDRIEEVAADGQVSTFEVLRPPNEEPEWRYSDSGRTTFRIHTKEIV